MEAAETGCDIRAVPRRQSQTALPLNVANTDSSSSGHSIAASAARRVSISGAVVKRAATDQQMRDAACLECGDVRTGHVFAVAGETAKEKTDVARLNGDEVFPFAGRKSNAHRIGATDVESPPMTDRFDLDVRRPSTRFR